MTEFEKTYQNYNPRQAALDEARALLTAAAKAAMAYGALPEAELPAFIVETPADTKNGDIASNIAMPCHSFCCLKLFLSYKYLHYLNDIILISYVNKKRWEIPSYKLQTFV